MPLRRRWGSTLRRCSFTNSTGKWMIKLSAEVMGTGERWAGALPIRRNGSTRLVVFRNMRLLDDLGDFYALGLASDRSTVRLYR